MNLIEDAFLQPRVLEHRAILGGDLVLIDDALKVVATGGERRGGNLRIECGTDRGRARLSRRVLSLFLAALAAPTPAPSAPTPAAFFRLLRLCARRSLGKRQGCLGLLHFRSRSGSPPSVSTSSSRIAGSAWCSGSSRSCVASMCCSRSTRACSMRSCAARSAVVASAFLDS